MTRAERAEPAALGTLSRIVSWYFSSVYGQREGPGLLPAHCDSAKVGHFAVDPDRLKQAEASSLFKLLIAQAMFQALRDVVIQRQQRAMTASEVQVVAELGFLKPALAKHPCSALRSFSDLAQGCNVYKLGKVVDCQLLPGVPCHVKQATAVFRRMGDMGKLSSSALLLFWSDGPTTPAFDQYLSQDGTATQRAEALVVALSKVHRMGEKLANMFVSALSTPALFGDYSPWYPQVDGNELVVVDTNVARAVELLRPKGARTYQAQAAWLRERARELDLRYYHADVPSYSPRLLQQALYRFCSKSNRVDAEDPCATSPGKCESCAPLLCPFGAAK
jgi:hypothetical protein